MKRRILKRYYAWQLRRARRYYLRCMQERRAPWEIESAAFTVQVLLCLFMSVE